MLTLSMLGLVLLIVYASSSYSLSMLDFSSILAVLVIFSTITSVAYS
jgi:hypothetical protein